MSLDDDLGDLDDPDSFVQELEFDEEIDFVGSESTLFDRALSLFTLPHFCILAGVTFSGIAWLLPVASAAGKGYHDYATTTNEILLLAFAYAMIVGCCWIGYLIGKWQSHRIELDFVDQEMHLFDDRVWNLWIAVAMLGVVATFAVVVQRMGLSGAINAIASFQANGLKKALYEDYSVGILSLRYVSILAGSVAIFRYLAFAEISLRSILSIGMLLVIAVIASRLSVVWACVLGGTVYLTCPSEMGKRRISTIEILGIFAVAMLALGLLTISRTMGFYDSHGASNPLLAVASEFQRYLAAPFQGALTAMNSTVGADQLQQAAGIDSELTTNSALLEYRSSMGTWAAFALGSVVFVSGLLCGILRRFSGTYLAFGYGIIQACHLEVWRIDMFTQGITITLFACVFLLSPVFLSLQLPSLNLPRITLR